MDIKALLEHLNNRLPVRPGMDAHACMAACCAEAQRVTARLNGGYRTPEEVRELMAELTGSDVDASFRLFPPFHCDFGKNIRLGRDVFINAGCCFQDQGGISIGDGTFIGHNVVLATLNHGFAPGERGVNHPAPIAIGRNVWIGSNATILPGVTIGDDSVVAAGAVVSKDMEPGIVVGGVPARTLKTVEEAGAKQGVTV